MRILIVEDETKLAELIKERLERENYITDICVDGETGFYEAKTGIYDLIVLDVMLPKKNGFEILKEIRKQNVKSKVIMLTAKSELDDKLLGLTGGADDYVTKPFHMEELVARINVRLPGGSNCSNDHSITAGDLKLNLDNSKLSCSMTGEEIDLIRKEFLLMEYFMSNPQQILSKEQIFDKVWGIDSNSESNNIEAYISFVRKKIRAIGSTMKIKSIRGLGYRLEGENE